jgi:hypothetical protein
MAQSAPPRPNTQVLVDWDDSPIYRTWFFAYFVVTWALLNVWALWGCAVLWPSSVPWTTFIVVNAQTVLMLIFYNRWARLLPSGGYMGGAGWGTCTRRGAEHRHLPALAPKTLARPPASG